MPRNARSEGYSRRNRFAARGSFGVVLRGSRKLRGRLAVIHVATGRGPVSRLGVALTRRLVASSVHRNAVKRVAREAFRRHAAKAFGLDLVVMLRSRFDPAHIDPLAAELRELLDQLSPGAVVE